MKKILTILMNNKKNNLRMEPKQFIKILRMDFYNININKNNLKIFKKKHIFNSMRFL
jgi:hypothetical protein